MVTSRYTWSTEGVNSSGWSDTPIIDRDLTAPPGSPTVGDVYIVATSATGAWAGQDGKVTGWNGIAWTFIIPPDGFAAWLADENVVIVYDAGTVSVLDDFIRSVSSSSNGLYPQSNLAASSVPTTTDDSASGYVVGSRWINTTADKEYICVDSTASAAVWVETTAQPGLKQTDFQEVGADTATTATGWGTDLLTSTITTGANRVILIVSASLSNSAVNKTAEIRLLVDGTPVRAATEELKTSNVSSTVAIAFRTAVLTAASHTFKVQWRTSGGTLQCRPIILAPDSEHASLMVEEVSV